MNSFESDYDKDCCFTSDKVWFRYRAAAIIIEDGSVLLASNEKADYYYSVGGGVHLGETSQQAVCREVFEETGVNYEIDRLAFVHENFFEDSDIVKGRKCHEIAFYYLMKPKRSKKLNSNSMCLLGKEYMNWMPIAELKNHKVFPTFFADKLLDLSENVEHIITRE